MQNIADALILYAISAIVFYPPQNFSIETAILRADVLVHMGTRAQMAPSLVSATRNRRAMNTDGSAQPSGLAAGDPRHRPGPATMAESDSPAQTHYW